MKAIIKFMFLVALGTSVQISPIYAQKNQTEVTVKEEKIKALVNSRAFNFIASSAQPLNASDINKVIGQMQGMGGSSQINLNGQGYQVSIQKDQINAHLPYYGRAYSAPIGNSDRAGYKFESKDYTIKQKTSKKGDIILNITPKDQSESIRMELNISKSGMAFLTINSNNRQSISYSGYIEEI